jgi:hypothetical protein
MWIFPLDGVNAAAGLAVVRPLALELALVVGTFNGQWDRDNIGPHKIDPSKGSTLESPFANKLTVMQTSTLAAAFTVAADGRRYLTNTDTTITTQDARLVVTACSSIRMGHSVAGAGEYLPYFVAFGVEVDGAVVWHSGYELVKLYRGAANDVDISFPRASAVIDVGAGSHYVVPFYDFVRGTPSLAAADFQPDACQQLETFLLIDECRR